MEVGLQEDCREAWAFPEAFGDRWPGEVGVAMETYPTLPEFLWSKPGKDGRTMERESSIRGVLPKSYSRRSEK